MSIHVHSTELVAPTRPLFDEARLAVAGFLARYSGPTRISYAADLRYWFAWCGQVGLLAFEAQRPHLELWARLLEERGLARATIGRRLSTLAGFYRFAVIDGILDRSPAEYVRRPRIDTESATLGLDRMELGAFIAQGAAAGPRDHAVACLLGLLGLRVSEACNIDIEDLSTERGHRTVTVLGKGHKLAVIPMPPRVGRAVDQAAGERIGGPLLLMTLGTPVGPPRGHPDRAPVGEAGRDHQAHLPALAAPQLHHRRPRRRCSVAGRADRRPPRRPQNHHSLRPGSQQPGPPRRLRRHRLRRRRVVAPRTPGH